MKRFFQMLLIALVSSGVFAADEVRPSRVDVTSVPAGVNIYVDGVNSGVTPLTLHSIKKGRHHIRAVKENFEQYDSFFEVYDGAYIQVECTMVPETGLLLLVTEPEGCLVELNNVSYGETPRFIPDLPLGKNLRFTLSKVGYSDRKIEVKLDSRVPEVRKEVLTQNSGSFDVRSTPSGADVYMGGVRRGVTPLTLEFIPKGNVHISIKKDGFKSFEQEFSSRPGVVETLDISLEPLPCTLSVNVTPVSAVVKFDGNYIGKGSQRLGNVLPGEHTLEVISDGYEPYAETLMFEPGKGYSRTVGLKNENGSLKVTTLPAGAEIFLNGVLKGRTKQPPGADGKARSLELVIDNLPEGEYELVAKLAGFADVRRKPKIRKKSDSEANIKFKKIFTPDVEVVTTTSKVRGVYIEKNARGVVIETSPGIKRTFRQSDVKTVNFLK